MFRGYGLGFRVLYVRVLYSYKPVEAEKDDFGRLFID